VAVTVRRLVDAVSGEAAVRVTTALPVPGAARLLVESVAVTPDGSPLTPRLTAELKPPPAVARTVNDALVPGCSTTADVLDVSVMPTTLTLTVVVFVSPSPVAVTVSVYVFGGTVTAAARFRFVDPDPGAARVAGEKVAVIPVGMPATLNEIGALNPFTSVEVI
jgi:hypothetical protein